MASYSFIKRVSEHRAELIDLRDRLHAEIPRVIDGYLAANPSTNLYAFALLVGQGANYLGYQLMTDELLASVVDYHYEHGYRHEDSLNDPDANRTRLREWLRWSNPDDDWFMEDFSADSKILKTFDAIAYRGPNFSENEEELFEYLCDDVLAELHHTDAWIATPQHSGIALGLVADDLDFFTSCVRCNPFDMAMKLWHEHFLGQEHERSIARVEQL